MNKKYILFDLDGTVTDPKIGITRSVQYSLKAFGIDIKDTDALIPFIGPPLRDSYKKLYGFKDADVENAVAKYREYFSTVGIFENTLYSGMNLLLKTLKDSGKNLIIATFKPTIYAAQILAHFNIDQYFSFVAGNEMDGRRSKKSEVIRHAIENCNIVSLNDAIMIGDKEHDVFGAKELGMDCIGVSYGYGSHQELSEAGADFIVESVDALSSLLGASV